MSITRTNTVTPSDLGGGQHRLSWEVKDEDDATVLDSGSSDFASASSPHVAMKSVSADIRDAIRAQETMEMLPSTFSLEMPAVRAAIGLNIYEDHRADITMTDEGDGTHTIAYSLKNSSEVEVDTGSRNYSNDVISAVGLGAIRRDCQAYMLGDKAVTDVPSPETIYFSPEESGTAVTLDPPYYVDMTRAGSTITWTVKDGSGTIDNGVTDYTGYTAAAAIHDVRYRARQAVSDTFLVSNILTPITLTYRPPDYHTGLLNPPYTMEITRSGTQITTVVKDGTPSTLDTDVTSYGAGDLARTALRASKNFAHDTVMAQSAVSSMGTESYDEAAFPVPVDTDPLDVSLRVENVEAFTRTNEHVTMGFPFSKGIDLRNTARLCIVNSSGTKVDGQFAVTSRYGGLAADTTKAIRWMLIDFQPTVNASTSSYYRLRQGQPKAFSSPITVTDSTTITVETGNLTVVFPKSGDGFISSIKRGATELLSARVNGTVTHNADGPFTCNVLGASVETDTDARVVIKSNGDWLDGVSANWVGGDGRPTGYSASQEDYEWTARATFFHGKDYFQLDFRLENRSEGLSYAYGYGHAFFDSCILEIPYSLGAVTRLVFPGHNETVDTSGDWVLNQAHSIVSESDETQNFAYTLKQDGVEEDSGLRTDGWCIVSDGTDAIWAGQRFFWENYPAELQVDTGNSDIKLHLWPDIADQEVGDFSQGNYWQAGGGQKTYECFIGVVAHGSIDTDLLDAQVAVPLIGLPTTQYYCSTTAWHRNAPDDFHSSIGGGSGDIWESLDRFQEYHQFIVDPTKGAEDDSIVKQRETRATNVFGSANRDMYGWERFGCIYYKNSFAGCHYGWSYVALNNLLKSRDIRWWNDVSYPMMFHHRDMDYCHSNAWGVGDWHTNNGMQWYEEGVDHKYFTRNHHYHPQGAGAQGMNVWNCGNALAYLLTGKTSYYESAEATASYLKERWWKSPEPNVDAANYDRGQMREATWTMQTFINMFRITGDTTWMTNANLVFTNCVEFTEGQSNPDYDTNHGSNNGGYILNLKASDTGGPAATITMQSYPLGCLLDWLDELAHTSISNTATKNNIIRKLDWMRGYCLAGGDGPRASDGYITCLACTYNWDPTNHPAETIGGQNMHNTVWAAGFARMYRELISTDVAKAYTYLTYARELFQHSIFYREPGHTIEHDDWFDPAERGPIKYTYYTTASRTLAWIYRWGQQYASLEWDINRGNV